MTAKEQAILTLEELASIVAARYSDAISLVLKEIQGESLFETKEESLYEKCNGECDKTYEIQSEYESVIHDAIEVLESVKGKTKEDCDKIQNTIRDLNLAI
jgi:hypothetical protein